MGIGKIITFIILDVIFTHAIFFISEIKNVLFKSDNE
nr:MAG TPA: hypothetical protein [Caudoviricetes sp.]